MPGPVAPLPPPLKKLQVGGTELPRLHESTQTVTVLNIELNPQVALSTGKAAAQAGHAAQLVYERLVQNAHDGDAHAGSVLAAWRADGFRVRVVIPTEQVWAVADRPVRVVDAGLTEIAQATETARAFW